MMPLETWVPKIQGVPNMKPSMKAWLLLLVAATMGRITAAQSSSFDLLSPDKRIEVRVRTANGIRFDMLLKGRALLEDCSVSMDIDHQKLGAGGRVTGSSERRVDQVLEPAVRQKFAKIRENYNELRIEIEGGYAIVFRAYNEGAAYRFETRLPGKDSKSLQRRGMI